MSEPTVMPGPLDLGELIGTLGSQDPAKVLAFGFDSPHSYRGNYWNLAFEIATNITVGEMLEAARSALGRTFTGWKGGEFTMTEHADVYLVWEEGECGETLGRVLLHLMLAAAAKS